ncbi:hypothetical protein [Streptomyces rectiverticillatus]|nr:hypothetical protein [Streptomyces rectiverticillatus]
MALLVVVHQSALDLLVGTRLAAVDDLDVEAEEDGDAVPGTAGDFGGGNA